MPSAGIIMWNNAGKIIYRSHFLFYRAVFITFEGDRVQYFKVLFKG